MFKQNISKFKGKISVTISNCEVCIHVPKELEKEFDEAIEGKINLEKTYEKGTVKYTSIHLQSNSEYEKSLCDGVGNIVLIEDGDLW